MLLALACCVAAFAALAEDYSGYTTEELVAMSAAINAELSARIAAGRTDSAESDFVWASDGVSVQINKYVGAGGDVVIPDEIGGLPVTQIGASAFANNSAIANVTLPAGLTTIGDSAFVYVKNTDEVLNLPASLEYMGRIAFHGTAYRGVVINSSVKDGGENVFSNSQLTFVYIREGAAPELGYWAFSRLKSLQIAIIPASVVSIGDKAFCDCPNLKIITPAGSAAEAFALAHFIPVETDTYELYAAQYDALYPMPE